MIINELKRLIKIYYIHTSLFIYYSVFILILFYTLIKIDYKNKIITFKKYYNIDLFKLINIYIYVCV